ncbi:MAG: class I SAM-dependent methyltransferase [Emticicia sp.]|uniref:class I SAM-dependent methyltransferase n=1 Tax=Emticicia sp. TaxID=1930953 RepID=UPI003BA60B37
MLINYDEYRMMYEAEEKLWWYRILHEKVLKEIQNRFQANKQIKILDAGCGTGGLMSFLIKHGYENIQGFDYSLDAVSFCKERNLDVQQTDITNFENVFGQESFDVIVNDDVVYQFDNSTIANIFHTFQSILKSDGIIITNNNAFNVFYGTHDIAVGGKQRFTLSDFEKTLENLPLKITHHTYWSLLLSPLILVVRLTQQIQLKLNLIDLKNIKSDVTVPSDFVNNFFYQIVKLEERLFKKGFFGSSLFLVLRKKL